MHPKLKKRLLEGRYPDMPSPEDNTHVELSGAEDLTLQEDPKPLDAETHARLIVEDLLKKAPKRPSEQLPPEAVAQLQDVKRLPDRSLEEEEGDGDEMSAPKDPTFDRNFMAKTLQTIKDKFAKKAGYRGDYDSQGNPLGGQGAAKGANTAAHPKVDWEGAAAKVAPRSPFDAARLPETPEGPVIDGVTEAAPEMTEPPALPGDLKDFPEAQEQMPDQAQVPNKQLAAAVNATSAVSDSKDAAEAMSREHAPEDRTKYLAALKMIATGGDNRLLGGGVGQYYDAQIAAEKEKQKGWLTERFRGDQMREKQREFGLRMKEDRLKAQELKNHRGDMLEIQRQRLESGDERAKGIQDRFNETRIQKVVGEMPQPRTVDAFKRLQKRLEDPTEIQGWDTAKTFDKAGRVSGVLSPTGIPFQIFANEWRKGTEAEGMMQDVMAIFQGISLDTSGKVLNEQEMANVEKRLGVAAGQSQAAFRHALKNELTAAKDRVDLYIRSQSPEVQTELDRRRVRPDFSPAQETGYSPKQHLSMPTKERFKDELKRVGKSLGWDQRASVPEAVEHAKSMEAREARERAREEAEESEAGFRW